MLALVELHEDFYDEIGGVDGRLAEFVEDADVTRWLNQGQRRLGWYVERTSSLVWAEAASSVDFPSDYASVSDIVPASGVRLPAGRVFGDALRFSDPEGADSAGTATLLYLARPAAITDSQDSELTDEGDAAIVSFAAYRFFRRLAGGRADYRRYATLTGANAVGLDEIDSLAQGYLDEFVAAARSVPIPAAVTFFGD